MAKRKEEADGDRPVPPVHQLARDIVDGGDVIGVDSMAQSETIGQESGPEQNRMVTEPYESPGPGAEIGADQNDIEGGNLAPQPAGTRSEKMADEIRH